MGQTLEGEEWFFPTLSRTRAEDILKEEVCVCVCVRVRVCDSTLCTTAGQRRWICSQKLKQRKHVHTINLVRNLPPFHTLLSSLPPSLPPPLTPSPPPFSHTLPPFLSPSSLPLSHTLPPSFLSLPLPLSLFPSLALPPSLPPCFM